MPASLSCTIHQNCKFRMCFHKMAFKFVAFCCTLSGHHSKTKGTRRGDIHHAKSEAGRFSEIAHETPGLNWAFCSSLIVGGLPHVNINYVHSA